MGGEDLLLTSYRHRTTAISSPGRLNFSPEGWWGKVVAVLSWIFLAVCVVGLAFTVNAYRPLRLEPVAVPSFFAGWLTSELPVHHLVWQAVAAAVFIDEGALRGGPGWAALAVTAVSWAGLVGLAVQASRASTVVDDALRTGLGDDFRQHLGDVTSEDMPVIDRVRIALPLLLRHRDVEKIRSIDYAGDGARSHRLDLYRPRRPLHNAPVLLYIHGGAWMMGDKREQGLPMIHHLASRGWVCVTINYRLSPRARFPDHLIDCKRALAWVKENIAGYGGDPTFVAVSGGSAGGHLAALVGLTAGDPSYQPGFEAADTSVAACLPFYGIYDFTNRDGLWRHGFGRFLERLVMRTSLAADPEAYRRASPIDQVHEGAPPFMVVQGANDTLVPVGEARAFCAALRGVCTSPVVYVELPGAQHAFEVFHSVRTAHVVQGAADFLAFVHAGRRRAEVPAAPIGR